VLKSIRATFNISFATHEFHSKRARWREILNMHSRFYEPHEGESSGGAPQLLSIWAYYHLFMIFYAMIKLKFLYWPRYPAALGWAFFVHLLLRWIFSGPAECN